MSHTRGLFYPIITTLKGEGGERRSSISDVSTGFPSPLWSFMDRCGHEIFFPLGDIVDTRPTDNTKLQSSMQLGRMLERGCVHIATSTFSRLGFLMLTVN